LLDEPGLRDRLGRAAVARALREFDDSLMARRSLETYATVLDRSRRTAGPAVSESREAAQEAL
jgi:hypothetical protein